MKIPRVFSRMFPVMFALAFLSTTNTSAGIVMSPYLQAVTKTSVYVLVECNSRDTVTVEYGPTDSYGSRAVTESIEVTTAYPETYVHNIKLTGLSPNAVYHYRGSQGGAPTADASFRTAVEPGTSFRFAWMADFRTGVNIHDAISARVKDAGPCFSLYGGDLCYNETYPYFKSEFFRTSERSLIAGVPFFNTPGNHEGWTMNTKAFTQAPESPSGTQDYYSFDYGDMHVLVLNTQIPTSAGMPQYTFAENDLRNSSRPWKVVICHIPAYCSGGHNEDANMKAMSSNIFEKQGVNLVLSGHSHFYQHNLVNGIHHLVIGSAGAPLHDPYNASYTIKSAKDYNYAIGDVTPTSLHLMVYNAAGAVLDSVDLRKGSSSVRERPINPMRYELLQNYPNPFNPATTIRFTLPVPGHATLRVFNALGEEVSTLLDKELSAGSHHVQWDAAGFAGGVYFYTLIGPLGFTETRKLTVVR